MTLCFEPVPIEATILQRQSSPLVCFFLLIFIPIPKSSASQPVDQMTLAQGLSLWESSDPPLFLFLQGLPRTVRKYRYLHYNS